MANRFQFVSKDYIDFRVRDRIPKNTQRNTNWGVNTWNLWVTARNNARQLGQCLWDKGLLSINDAVGLSKVVYFYNCKVFGLRSRDEHNNLQAEQYTFSSDEAGNFVLYHGRASKNTTGGLNQRKVSLKQIKQYDTGNNLCVYRVFKKYLDLIGNGGYFYRKPLEPLYEGHINFSSDKLSSKTLSSYIGNLMKQAGFEGRYTGHSGKVTLATTLYQSGVDEQLIKERTGHRSEAVRQYKRTSSEQQKYISRLVDIPTSLLLDKENACENILASGKKTVQTPLPLKDEQTRQPLNDKTVNDNIKWEIISDDDDNDLLAAVEHYENVQVEPISYNYIHKKFRAQEYVENKNDMPNFDIGYSFE